MAAITATAQPRYDRATMQHETLNRGVVALKSHDGRVYASSGAPGFTLDFGTGTTGITEIEKSVNAGNEAVFNLNGQRVAQPKKGLYIVNGKKVIIK